MTRARRRPRAGHAGRLRCAGPHARPRRQPGAARGDQLTVTGPSKTVGDSSVWPVATRVGQRHRDRRSWRGHVRGPARRRAGVRRAAAVDDTAGTTLQLQQAVAVLLRPQHGEGRGERRARDARREQARGPRQRRRHGHVPALHAGADAVDLRRRARRPASRARSQVSIDDLALARGRLALRAGPTRPGLHRAASPTTTRSPSASATACTAPACRPARRTWSPTYRVGTGLPGLVDAGQLTLLMTRPLGVRGVTNPLPTGLAADPDPPDTVRRNAPRTRAGVRPGRLAHSTTTTSPRHPWHRQGTGGGGRRATACRTRARDRGRRDGAAGRTTLTGPTCDATIRRRRPAAAGGRRHRGARSRFDVALTIVVDPDRGGRQL